MTEIVIVGGGLAGAAAAIHLARAGRDVTLIEKETAAHDKVCGEFLSHEAVGYLSALGVDLDTLGAVPIDRVRFAGRERRLPFAARSLSRRVLDEALLACAGRAGATIRRGQSVQKLSPAGTQGYEISLRDGDNRQAANVFLASGKHDVRGLKRPDGRQNDLVAFKMHYRLDPEQQRRLSGTVELFLFPGGYGGLEPIEEDKANLCFLVRRATLEKNAGRWEALVTLIGNALPLLSKRLAGGLALWEKPLAISAIPYGYVRRGSGGLWYLGDQAAVIPSFSGDGMSIALHSAQRAASIYLAGGTANAYQAQLARDVGRQVWLATAISSALVDPAGRHLCSIGAAWVPRLIGIAAKATRIPDRVLAA